VLINEQGQGGELDYSIYLRGTDGSTPMHVGSGIPMALSPDGRWVVARTSEEGDNKLVLYPTGPGKPRVVADLEQQTWAAFTPDSRRIVFFSGGSDEIGFHVHELDGETRRLPYDTFRMAPFSDTVTPDGERFVGQSNAGPFFLLSLDGSEPVSLPGLTPGDSPLRFSADGRWLWFYRQGMPALYGRVEVAGGRREELGQLAPEHRAGAVGVWPVLLSEDGTKYVYSYPRFLTDLFLIDGLR
jgi:Tol biopolymer transport system component